jgi:hypothetical protein
VADKGRPAAPEAAKAPPAVEMRASAADMLAGVDMTAAEAEAEAEAAAAGEAEAEAPAAAAAAEGMTAAADMTAEADMTAGDMTVAATEGAKGNVAVIALDRTCASHQTIGHVENSIAKPTISIRCSRQHRSAGRAADGSAKMVPALSLRRRKRIC